jgi:hypothetical protein
VRDVMKEDIKMTKEHFSPSNLKNKTKQVAICIGHFFLFKYWGVESILGPLGTAATTGLLYLPRVIVRMEKLVE